MPGQTLREVPCPPCGGTGVRGDGPCGACHGSGRMRLYVPEPPLLLTGDGTYRLEPRGTGREERQAALLEIAGRKHQGGVNLDVDATLVREPDNQYDPRAVRVELAGPDGAPRLVGYLSREHARDVVIALEGRMRATCRARIVGGWKREAEYRKKDGTERRAASEGHFGVRLDVVLPIRGASEVTE